MGISRLPIILYDFSKKSSVNKYFNFLIKSLQLTPSEIRKLQNEKLKILITNAYKYSPYYHKLFESNNLTPDSINSIDDLPKIPVLTRKDLIAFNDTILSTAKNLPIYLKKSSSGTTGLPVIYYKDVDSFSAGTAAGYFSWYLSGWDFGKKRINIWGNINSIKSWKRPGARLKRLMLNQLNIPSTAFNNFENYHAIAQRINKFKPYCISGYTSSIYSFSRYCLDNNIQVEKCKGVFTTAENLLDHHKVIIEKVLGPVCDTYGCGEINGIASQSSYNENYYIIEPHVIVENEPNNAIQMSEAIVTDLDNKLMPFIRYKVGDLISEVNRSDLDVIPFKSFKKVFGRTADLIYLPNGNIISPINFLGGTMFRELGGIKQHKVIWNGAKLTFLFLTNSDFDLERTEKVLQNELLEYEVPFTIKIVTDFPVSSSGKFKYFEIEENAK